MTGEPESLMLHLLREMRDEQRREFKSIRSELAEIRSLALLTSEHSRRVDRRVGELRDDLELMVKAEIGGAVANLEIRLEQAWESRGSGGDPSTH